MICCCVTWRDMLEERKEQRKQERSWKGERGKGGERTREGWGNGMIWYDMIIYTAAKHDMIRYEILLCYMIWYDIKWNDYTFNMKWLRIEYDMITLWHMKWL